ncbi:MAG: SUMF1/EgtB/PvdO family nonheme iron enzyme [Chitinispirillaceae bacterium]|jgi:formylglycine-generating enzyme required for sulfatase activity|nr:SUMF1/EgtB/PvdO family nonheme iron enzyme [Chitinispirillaceae bacterium]
MKIRTLCAAGALLFSCSDLLDTTPGRLPPPEAVVLEKPEQTFATGFTIRWHQSASEDFSAYNLYCDDKPGPDETSRIVWRSFYRNDTCATITTLDPSSVWHVRLRVYNASGFSESNELTVATVACSCGVFTGITREGMVLIPPGGFLDSSGYCATSTRGFYLDTTEVTEREWAAVMTPDSLKSSGKPKGNITWFQALLFCNRKSVIARLDTCYTYSGTDSTGTELLDVKCDYSKNGFRLPSEDEWEYAYAAGTNTGFYWGKNYSGLSESAGGIYPKTAADTSEINSFEWWNLPLDTARTVAQKKPNPWKLHDMAGNVAELIGDGWSPRVKMHRFDYVAPGPSYRSDQRMMKGGMFYYPAQYMTRHYRDVIYSTSYGISLGFRPARNVD